MGEALLNAIAGDRFEAESAGLEAGDGLNPFVVEVLQEIGIDISAKKTKKIMDLYESGKTYDYVIAVCDAAQAELCPVFPGVKKQLNWPFPDPAYFKGTREEKLRRTREIREEMMAKIEEWIREIT